MKRPLVSILDDEPEIVYKSYRNELTERGYDTTTDLLVDPCRVAFEGGMLPHTNAGILSAEEMTALRPWNASMGLMMETTSQRLRPAPAPGSAWLFPLRGAWPLRLRSGLR